MSCEDKMIPMSPSPKTPISESPCTSRSMCVKSNMEAPHTPNQQQADVLDGPVAILWDIENCPVPIDVRPEDVAGNIRMALRVHPVINGAVTLFSAYGDFNAFPRRLREGCQRTGVKLVDVPNGRKDAADKAILVDMFLFALDNRPPSSILLISGDVDFAPALHILGQRGYTVILVIPCRVGVATALTNAGRFVWDWPSVARGEGFVPPKTYIPRGPDFGGHLISGNFGDKPDVPNEEESIVYRGISQRSQIYFCSTVQECSANNMTPGSHMPSSRSESLPSELSEASMNDQNGMQGWWVQPGDIQGLKAQLVRLCEISGGTLPLVRVPPEYLKSFGRPLYMSEYGVCKLVNLIGKMADTFVVVGKGHNKLLCLRNNRDKQIKKFSSPENMMKDQKGKGMVEDSVDIRICPNMGSSSSDFSEDERNGEFDDRFDGFRQEVQELLVCYGYLPVPLSVFESLYEQRYKRAIDFQSFGVEGLEELMEKVKDVVLLCEDPGSKRKFLHLVVNG
ncbi:uncharacterized protein A4U43_C08F16440 [Asparagus officinalis]|nr:uncharacterized protein LOC109819743 isoform X3 [Asparagus officinalis]XP_020241197.1 uncharacterized protein LOC109819743 isoform X3 [Asparagus officinalis]ONK60278.1 uncharacterized protein A4U43_C08F16440 [Asparagus officinalis]